MRSQNEGLIGENVCKRADGWLELYLILNYLTKIYVPKLYMHRRSSEMCRVSTRLATLTQHETKHQLCDPLLNEIHDSRV